MLRQWWKRHTDDADEGAATAEFAVVLPCVAAVAILVLCLGRASVVSMNCQDAAAAGARAFAVDDTGGESKARTAVMAAAGGSATVRFERGVDFVTVTVQCPVVPDPTGVLPTRVTGKATRYFYVAPKRAGLCAVRCGIVGCGLCMEVCEVWSLRHTTCETCCETLLATI